MFNTREGVSLTLWVTKDDDDLKITASFLTDCADTGATLVAGFLSSCGLLGCVDGSFSCPTRCKLPCMSS